MLTARQRDVLYFIDAEIKAKGCSPSYDEMARAMGLRSKSGITRVVNSLVERGFVIHRKHQVRSLEVLRLPNASAPPPVDDSKPLLTALEEIERSTYDVNAQKTARHALDRWRYRHGSASK